MTNFDLIFDNAGGITLQTADYCHHFYGREADAAECVSNLLEPGEMPECWDGNEPEHRIEYDYEVERNGGYRWITCNDVLEAVGQLLVEDREEWLEKLGGYAEREFFKALFQRRDKAHMQQ